MRRFVTLTLRFNILEGRHEILGSTGWKGYWSCNFIRMGGILKRAGRETIHAGNYLSDEKLNALVCAHLFAVLILGVSGAAIPSFGQELPQQDTSKPEQSATQTGNESSTPPAQAKPEDQEHSRRGKRVFGVLPVGIEPRTPLRKAFRSLREENSKSRRRILSITRWSSWAGRSQDWGS